MDAGGVDTVVRTGADDVDGTGRTSAGVALGTVLALGAASGLYVTERAGGELRWWWIAGLVVVAPAVIAVVVAPRGRRIAVGVGVLVAATVLGVLLERGAPIPAERVVARFEQVALPPQYPVEGTPYLGDNALGVGGHYVSASFRLPDRDPEDVADELCASLRAQGWAMRCRYEMMSTTAADAEFASGRVDHADLWGSDGRFRVAVELPAESGRGVLVVATDQPPLGLPFLGGE